MLKSDAIKMFDDVASLAAALGITRHAIYQWPEQLTQRQADEIHGAALRLGKLPAQSQKDEAAA